MDPALKQLYKGIAKLVDAEDERARQHKLLEGMSNEQILDSVVSLFKEHGVVVSSHDLKTLLEAEDWSAAAKKFDETFCHGAKLHFDVCLVIDILLQRVDKKVKASAGFWWSSYDYPTTAELTIGHGLFTFEEPDIAKTAQFRRRRDQKIIPIQQ